MKNSIKSSTYVISLLAVPLLAQAQIAPDAGSVLRDQQKPALELPKRPAPDIKLDEPVRPALKPSAERFLLKGFRITGNRVFAERELLAVLQDYAGKNVEFADLEQAAARISRYYRDRGYFVARAYLPAQQITDGVVEIAVIEGRYGKVEYNNPSRVREAVIGTHTAPLVGETVYELKLERKLLLLSDLAGVAEARARLSPGTNVGETTLTVEIVPAPPFNGSVEIDNHGNRFSGGTRLTGRLAAASPLRLGDVLSAQVTHGFDGLDYARVAYQVPLGGDGVKLGGSYVYSRYRLGRSFAALDASGESESLSADVSYPFIRTRNVNLYGRVSYHDTDFEDRIGLSWARAQDFQVKLTLAARIGSQRAQSDTDERVRGWFQAIKYF